jgi:hypothetical protein
MQTITSNNGMGKVRETPKRKSVIELAKTIPFGRYKGLSKILAPDEIPKK